MKKRKKRPEMAHFKKDYGFESLLLQLPVAADEHEDDVDGDPWEQDLPLSRGRPGVQSLLLASTVPVFLSGCDLPGAKPPVEEGTEEDEEAEEEDDEEEK